MTPLHDQLTNESEKWGMGNQAAARQAPQELWLRHAGKGADPQACVIDQGDYAREYLPGRPDLAAERQLLWVALLSGLEAGRAFVIST